MHMITTKVQLKLTYHPRKYIYFTNAEQQGSVVTKEKCDGRICCTCKLKARFINSLLHKQWKEFPLQGAKSWEENV